MTFSKKCVVFFRVFAVLFLLVLGMASSGECSRPLVRVTDLETRLPRGPVPPAGASPCHNELSPYNRKEVSSSITEDDYISCP
ncbi:hypothetical protein ACOSP7_019582 [Xanthoceras sorbifolium]